MLKILLVIISTFFVSMFYPIQLLAFDEIYDEFDTIDYDLWSLYSRDGSITIENGYLNLIPPLSWGLSPYIYGKFNTLLEEGTGLEFKFKTNKISSHGMGISVGFTGSSDYPFYEFSLWFDTDGPGVKFEYNDFSISKYHCEIFLPWQDIADRKVLGVNLVSDDWNIFRLTRENDIFSVYLNNLAIGSSIVSYTNNNCLPKNVILGNPLTFDGNNWSSFSIDYFKNYYLDSYPIPQEKHKKYILIPGLGASWNTRAMVYGDNVNNEDWSMTPFVTNYQNISSYFDSKNLDYDVWNYDWRRPLSEILSNFEEYVDENITEDDEVYIIGHSLGGLVARMWYQNNLDDNRIGKVITVGSPHKGAIKAYEAYNGGKLIEGYDFGWTVWNLYLTLISKGGSTMIDTIRKEAPILRDLSPTYEFLSKNNVLFPREQSEYFNLYLSDWNSNFNNWDKVWPIAGIGEETKYVINLKNRSIFDQVLDLWPDGKPDTYEYGDGDGTVLTESAGFGKENRIEVVGGHTDLISTFLNRILYILEVEESNLSDAYGEYNGRIFYLGSPAEMKVKCEGIEEKSDNNGFVFVSRTENDSNCQVKIQGTDDGVYHLVLADTQLNNWQYYENRIKENDEDVFEVDNRANLTKSIVNENFMSEMIQGDVNKLQEIFKKEEYKNVKKAISRKDWKYVIDWSLSFRRKHREQFYTKRIVENCIRIETNRISHSKTNWRNNYVKVAENLLNILQKFGHMKGYGQKEISTFEANNYYWMENTLDRIKTSNDSGEKFLLFNTFIKLFSMF